jgi:hypothetical protein
MVVNVDANSGGDRRRKELGSGGFVMEVVVMNVSDDD